MVRERDYSGFSRRITYKKTLVVSQYREANESDAGRSGYGLIRKLDTSKNAHLKSWKPIELLTLLRATMVGSRLVYEAYGKDRVVKAFKHFYIPTDASKKAY